MAEEGIIIEPDPGVAAAVEAAREVETGQRRSFFVDDKSSYAGKVTLDGVTFYFDLLPPDICREAKTLARTVARELGVAVELFTTPGGRAQLTQEQQDQYDAAELAMQDRILCAALRSWTLPVNCTDERKRALMPDLKAKLAEAILLFAVMGVDEARFHSMRGAGITL